MAARPYSNLRIEELDRLFTESRYNESRLHAILSELDHRTTARAIDLKRRLEKHLKTALPVSTNSASSIRPQSPPTPKPAQLDLHQSRAASTTGAGTDNSRRGGSTGRRRSSRSGQARAFAFPARGNAAHRLCPSAT